MNSIFKDKNVQKPTTLSSIFGCYNILLAILLIIPIIFCSVSATDRYDILVNDDYSGADQHNPRIAADHKGHFAIVWSDSRYGVNEIFYQLFDSTGSALGYNVRVNDDYSATPHIECSIDAGEELLFYSVWKDYRNGDYPYNPDIFFAPADSAFTPINFKVTVNPPELTCKSPDIAILADGSSIVVWSDYRYNNWDIWGQRIAANGSLIGTSFRINDDSGNHQQQSPCVAAFIKGGFVVVWHDNRSGDDDIFGQRYDSSAIKIGQNILVSADIYDTRQAFPSVATDNFDRFSVAWVDWCNGSYPNNPDIYMRRFDSSGTALINPKKVNASNNLTAQREVSIAADKMGNIGVVWSDSSSGEWNVMAQVYDFNGIAVGNNFMVHQLTTGKQLQPDVASDGYKFYYCWADSRNDNFDIYLSIIQYNEPSLLPDPDKLEFRFLQGGSLPISQTAILNNAGIGEINYRAETLDDWLVVTPISGTTPDTITISIVSDTLTYGIYNSGIRLIDEEHNDSSEVIRVRLTVTAPIMEITPDTLYFKVLAEIGNPESRIFAVNNIGEGGLNWTAEENSDWFLIESNSGSDGEDIAVQVDISGLQYGNYYEPIIIYSDEAVNSPETSWVHLELVGNLPYLECRTAAMNLSGLVDDTLFGEMEIVNLGAGSLNWTAVVEDDWLELDKYSGGDYDTIRVTVKTSTFGTGTFTSSITIYDSASFNKQIMVPVDINLLSGDTIRFYNSNIFTGGTGVMPLYLNLKGASVGGYIPLAYDISTATLDSITANAAALPSFVDFLTGSDKSGTGEIGFYVMDIYPDSLIPPGTYHLANLFFSGGGIDAFNYVDTASSDSSAAYIFGQFQNKKVPITIGGDLIIGSPTDVIDPDNYVLPVSPSMTQNYPNPFNSSTNIEIYLPRLMTVNVAVYNILGQQVDIIFEGDLAPGRHLLEWDGYLENGQTAPSGMYFCRLICENYREIRKMVLLK